MSGTTPPGNTNITTTPGAADAPAGKSNFEQAMSLLTMMSTGTQLFAGLTGAAWAVLVPNTMALPTSVLVAALSLHSLLGFAMFAALRGLGANMEQRLNLSRWQEKYPAQKNFLGQAAWFGIPKDDNGVETPSFFSESWFREKFPPTLKTQIDKNLIVDEAYAIPRYPTLRMQRWTWPLIPLCAAVGSLILAVQAWNGRAEHENACTKRFIMLQEANVPMDLDRARYLLDKANCDVSTQSFSRNIKRERACDSRFTMLLEAKTPVDLDRARYLLDKANCDVGTRPL